MIKIIFLSFIFLFSLFAESDFIKISAYRNFIDINETETIQTITDNNLFTPSQKGSFSYPKTQIWTNFVLKNHSNTVQNIVMTNEQHTTREVDVLFIRKSGEREMFFLGADRPLATQKIGYRYPSIAIQLSPNEEITVFARYKSPTSINTEWKIYDAKEFLHKMTIETLAWGIAIGALMIMTAYNLNIFFSIKDQAYFFYSLMTLGILWYQPTINGIYYMLDGDLGKFALTMANTISATTAIFTSLFVVFFFNLKQNSKILYKIYIVFISVLILFATSYFVGIFIKYNILSSQLYAVFASLWLLLIVLSGLFAVYKKLPGGFYFTAGTGIYAISFIFQTAYLSGNSANNYFLSFAPLIGSVFDMLFLSLALGKKIAKIDDERRMANKLMLEHSKFISIGQILAGVIHQLKQPITYLGAVTARLEMIFEENDRYIAKDDKTVVADLQKIVLSMDDTVMKFHELYAKEKSPSIFLLDSVVDESINMLSSEIFTKNITINRVLQKNVQISGYPKAIEHAVTVIIQNSIDILTERTTANPTISIHLNNSDGKGRNIITIEDNGGGIYEKPIEKIFEMYHSAKKTKGFGIGLALAKEIVVVKCAGDIKASNTDTGAKFEIYI